MSHNDANTSQSETLTLVTVEDLAEHCPECGMTASEHAAFPSLRRLCSMTPGKILIAHWERVVRREMAKELDRIRTEIDALDEWPDDKVVKTHHILLARAEAIRNG